MPSALAPNLGFLGMAPPVRYSTLMRDVCLVLRRDLHDQQEQGTASTNRLRVQIRHHDEKGSRNSSLFCFESNLYRINHVVFHHLHDHVHAFGGRLHR
jgi:hypothetical protein